MKIKSIISFLVLLVSLNLYPHEGGHSRYSKEQIIGIAMSAGPENVSNNATIISHDGSLLREGSNGWVCMPGSPPNENVNPMCVDLAWHKILQENKAKKESQKRRRQKSRERHSKTTKRS